MDPIRWARLRLRAIVARRRLEREMHEEMREHLARATERLVARGMPEREARLEARREFGNVTMLQAEARDARGGRWVDAIAGDLRFAVRHFGRRKATTALIVVVLALGTGANTLIFSMLQAYFLRPAPAMPDDGRLVRLWSRERVARGARWELRGFTGGELTALAARRETFAGVAAWTEDDVIVRGDRADGMGPREASAQFVTPDYFAVAGVPLVAGTGLRPSVDGTADLTGVMSWGMAAQRHDDPAEAVGTRVLVNEVPVTIVGVAPPRFQGAMRNMDEPALWMPLSARAAVAHTGPGWLADSALLAPFARLAPGASRERAAALVAQVVARARPDSAARTGMARRADALAMTDPPPSDGPSELVIGMTFMIGLGVLVLLVACTNVSALMVAAAVARRHEIAVRLSLGASRVRVLRQLLTESVLLAVAGGTLGLLLTWGAVTYSMHTEIDGVDLAPDAMTCAYALLVAVVTGVLFGLSPALHATRGAVAGALRDSGTGTSTKSRLQRGFVVAQIALSQPLLLVLGTMLALVAADFGAMPASTSTRVVALGVRPLASGAPGQRPADVDTLAARLRERPEVEAVVPEAAGFALRTVVAPPRGRGARADSVPTVVHLEGVAPGWFAALDLPIVMGRDVTLADTAAAGYPVVIGTALARRLWGDANPIGRTLPSPAMPGWGQDSSSLTVVGVYGAWAHDAARDAATTRGSGDDRVYTARGAAWRRDALLVRTRGPAAPFVPELRRLVREAAPSLPVTSLQTLAQVDAWRLQQAMQAAGMAGAGGALALLLASLGLYGVVSLAVRQRTREIGIRIAVGAEPRRVARMFLGDGVRAGALALVIGLPLSVVALKVALSQGLIIAPDVNPYAIGAAIAVLLLGVATAATWAPARRASRIDPARTLRTE